MAGDLDAKLDHLYDLPPEQFVAARDALARQLTGAERDAVRALRRPSVVAAIANRLARDEPQALRALLAAGEQLRAAQLGGAGDVRAAVTAQRSAIDALVKAARKHGAIATNVDRLRTLLQAVAGDDDLRAALERGRIEREPEAGGAWPALALTDGPARPKARKTTRAAKGGGSRARRRAPATEGDGVAAASEQARRKAETEEHDRLLAAAEARHKERDRAATRAEQAADQAQTRLQRATAATTKARAALDAAEESEAAAREEAQRALRALKAAQAQLQEAEDDVAALRRAAPASS